MKKTFLLLFIPLTLLFSCTPSEELLVVDFTATVTGESPNATIEITNNSIGAESFAWSFSEGANIPWSTNENPSTISVDKAGEFEIKLVGINGSEMKKLTKSFVVTGNNSIQTFTDVEFAQNHDDITRSRFFSTTEGKMYRQFEIDATVGHLIDLVYKGDSGINGFHFFESPDDLNNTEFEIPNATKTKIDNYQSGFEIAIFDEMIDDQYIN